MASELSIQVVSDAEAETADFVVCCRMGEAPAFMRPSNLRGTCHDCGCAVEFSRTSPKTPPRLCISCAVARSNGGTA